MRYATPLQDLNPAAPIPSIRLDQGPQTAWEKKDSVVSEAGDSAALSGLVKAS